MWVIAKIKNKYQDTLKNEFRKALRGKCSFYNPVFEKSYKQSHSNRIILKKKNLLNSYIFCYSELFEDKINLRKISSTVGLDYFLSIWWTSEFTIFFLILSFEKPEKPMP